MRVKRKLQFPPPISPQYTRPGSKQLQPSEPSRTSITCKTSNRFEALMGRYNNKIHYSFVIGRGYSASDEPQSGNDLHCFLIH
ncbi:hypothetical protein J6590_043454 [Homalodisca vitripennis]|nr:hypothetical protein J6590_043454 [Homalodisca vitripennis]